MIFLGVYQRGTEEEPWFAIDVTSSETKENTLKELDPEAEMLHVYPGALQLEEEDAAICAQARSLFDWHFRQDIIDTFSSHYGHVYG